MRRKKVLVWLSVLTLLIGLLPTSTRTHAASLPAAGPARLKEVTAFDLILAMNTLRVSYGLPPLIEDPIVNAVAQATAEYMAINQMSWHIGDVRGRLAAAGYGGGATVWATENFAVGYEMSIDQIMLAWSDPDHMLPAVVPAYCHVGAGVAVSPNGMTYYVLQAAYTSTTSCGAYPTPVGSAPPPGGYAPPASQFIVPVQIATPDSDGRTYHVVAAGQSLWAIAIAYKVTIRDLEIWNNISRDIPLQVGQRLFIPSGNTEGYATPTPVGMVLTSTPNADGKIIHTVQAYQTLITIAQAYGVTVETILALNGLQLDWPLQIGQRLLIFPGWVTPSPTPRPLTPIEKLTPASDGKYYHIVHSGETLSWIASLYNISVADLMAWNGLNNDSIIRPEQRLLLLVTPPATLTPTPLPPSATPTLTSTPLPVTSTPSPIHISPTTAPPVAPRPIGPGIAASLILALAVAGLTWFGLARRKR